MDTVETPKTSSYSSSHRAYYARNKETILEKYRETKPYKAFYERNKERLRQKALDRYYQNKLNAEMNANTTETNPPENSPAPETPAF
jgi:hypothetical protein